MGGSNYYFCGNSFLNFTQVSRCISLAYSEMELANVVLADVIVMELKGRTGSFEEIIFHLQVSKNNLQKVLFFLSCLLKQVESELYIELPSISINRLFGLVKEGLLVGSWRKVLELRQEEGYCGLISCFEEQVRELINKSEALIFKSISLKEPSLEGKLNEILERNLRGNFRKDFADLAACWIMFKRDFHNSALISAEMSYEDQGSGSLVDMIL